MSTTYGYASDVGDWMGSIALAEAEQAPVPGVRHVLQQLRSVFGTTHQVSAMRISWVEYSEGEAELAFHELEDYPVESWDQVLEKIEALRSSTAHRFAINCVFLDLSTRVMHPDGEVWVPRSAQLQLSIDQPELRPTTIEVGYTTYIDAWLSTTYGDNYEPRSNHRIAAINRSMLHDVLWRFRKLTVGEKLQLGKSDLYPFAVTEHGFVDADDLPRRKPRT